MDNGAWTNADKLAQIPKMDIIYGASAVTVIAACGTDSNAGLPGIHVSNTRTTQTVGKIGDQIFVSIHSDPMEAFWQSIWCSRAWTFQEFLLSKRHLIFLPEQVVFHCSTLSWCEDQPLEFIDNPNAHTMSVPAWTKSWNLRPIQLPERSKCAETTFFPAIFINQYYNQWLKNYLKRRLTVPSDILFGFDGALSASNRFLGKFHHGLPVDFFCESLHWDVGQSSMSWGNDPYQGLTQRRPGFPSWSWTGWMWNVASFEEFHINYAGKTPDHWCRVGIWGTRISASDNVELWQICSPDVDDWERLNLFPSAALAADTEWVNGELPKQLEIVKRAPIPSNCLVFKSLISTVFISPQPLNQRSNALRAFPSSDFSSEKPLGGISLSKEWRNKIEDGLQVQIIVVGNFFSGPDTRFPDQTDEDDPHIKCLVVQQVDDGIFERLTTFVAESSLMRDLEWMPIVAVLQ